jgi:outer membrane protein assembly factor BamD (BamD/ComL family)
MSTLLVYDKTRLYQACALIVGLRLYSRTKIRPGRGWTPTAMLRTATSLTHVVYLRGQYAEAIADLEVWIANYPRHSVI